MNLLKILKLFLIVIAIVTTNAMEHHNDFTQHDAIIENLKKRLAQDSLRAANTKVKQIKESLEQFAINENVYENKLVEFLTDCSIVLNPIGNFLYEPAFSSELKWLQNHFVAAQIAFSIHYFSKYSCNALHHIDFLNSIRLSWPQQLYHKEFDSILEQIKKNLDQVATAECCQTLDILRLEQESMNTLYSLMKIKKLVEALKP